MHSFGTLVRFIWRSSKRAVVFVVGVALMVIGLIMFVTPGPGIVVLVAGLAVLASEFAWAEHLLDKAKESAAKAGRSAQKVPGVTRVTRSLSRLIPRRWRRSPPTEADSEVTAAGPADVVAGGESETTIVDVTAAAADIEPASSTNQLDHGRTRRRFDRGDAHTHRAGTHESSRPRSQRS